MFTCLFCAKVRMHRSTTMLHITEDTPADMLSGAMDLTIHLPSGKTTKMCVERSTPMMDLLVQITTNHQLQITNYTLQPLQISPDSSFSEKILSYYPNTPIGALDTQHVRIVPKTKTLPAQKTVPVGHQPFESTFRLKVHLPRNQLFVTRVSRHVHIGDIMRKVCEEKNLDPKKCEVRHPGNFDEVLDPKLTLNDYMITEIYLILKGKEEERKHLHSKTGGGVFNLIFRRGKTNSVSTSTSAPVYSEGSRSVTPPVAPVQIITPPKPDTQPEKPKVPLRKRRPAPKPPIPVDKPQNDNAEGKVSSIVSDNSATSDICVKNETNVMICHSRHSSDSSGYHETSILSDHCNTSLPRRSIGLEGDRMGKSLNRHSQSIGNLSKMTEQSRSTSSLAFAGRKKKAAPPPPKFLQDSSSSKPATQKPSPLVASQTPVDYNQSNIGKVSHVPAYNYSTLVSDVNEYVNRDVTGEKVEAGKSKSLNIMNLKRTKTILSVTLRQFLKKLSFRRINKASCPSPFEGTLTLGKIYGEGDVKETSHVILKESGKEDILSVTIYESVNCFDSNQLNSVNEHIFSTEELKEYSSNSSASSDAVDYHLNLNEFEIHELNFENEEVEQPSQEFVLYQAPLSSFKTPEINTNISESNNFESIVPIENTSGETEDKASITSEPEMTICSKESSKVVGANFELLLDRNDFISQLNKILFEGTEEFV
ncbi:hypothetical protein WA026_001095 [Henosepilachna vigintioctopunctata]|uniref:RBD domain-containing protein n=1 Tax=Henosepilachna vigintioctopunctata TaxID=420089 RepID=A0AAW1V0M4_9CUCU